MSFNDNAQLDTSQVQSGGSGGFGGGGGGGGFPGGIQVGGGIGGLILLVLMLIFGGGKILGGGDSGSTAGGLPSQQLQSDQVAAAGQVDQGQFSQCKTGADANKNDVCLIIATVNSVQDYWSKALPKYQMNYEPVKTVIYQGQTQSECGTAQRRRSVPFYCPLDAQGLRGRELLPGAPEQVRRQRWPARQGVRHRPRVRPPHPGPPRHPEPRPAGPAGPQLRRRSASS